MTQSDKKNRCLGWRECFSSVSGVARSVLTEMQGPRGHRTGLLHLDCHRKRSCPRLGPQHGLETLISTAGSTAPPRPAQSLTSPRNHRPAGCRPQPGPRVCAGLRASSPGLRCAKSTGYRPAGGNLLSAVLLFTLG